MRLPDSVCRVQVFEGDPARVATVLPGRGYTPQGPLLHYATVLLLNRGWTVRQVWWDPVPTSAAEVQEEARDVLAGVDADQQLVVGKCLGAFALPVAVEISLPGIWLTPVLAVGGLSAALSAVHVPSLLVGGEADPLWDSALAHRVRSPQPQVVQVPGADHSLEVTGDERRSLQVLGDVVGRMSAFVDQFPRLGAVRPTAT